MAGPEEGPARRRRHGLARRVPWGTMSRQQIVAAALEEVRAGRYEQMTVRSLARRLGVAPMSLYRHVRDKNDLLDEVVDQLLAETWRPRSKPGTWRTWIADAADRLRRLLVTQPAALHVYLSHPAVSPAAVARMEAILSVLRAEGFDEGLARRAYAALHTYTIGFAALEAGRSGWKAPEGDEADVAHRLASLTSPRQFAEGLGYLLDGIEGQRSGTAPAGAPSGAARLGVPPRRGS